MTVLLFDTETTGTESACACGCGGALEPLDSRGRSRRYLHGHNRRGLASNWRGGRIMTDAGYVVIHQPEHPHAMAKGYVFEHRAVVERAIGRVLRIDAPVHHVNENKEDNRPQNLVACHDAKYHKLLHLRTAAMRACGKASWRCCWICRRWDAVENLLHRRGHVHRECRRERGKQRYALRKAVA